MKHGTRISKEALEEAISDLLADGDDLGFVEEGVRYARFEARQKHGRFASWHEAYAVIVEELEEFWDSVKADDPDPFELLQVAACCQLAIHELAERSEG